MAKGFNQAVNRSIIWAPFGGNAAGTGKLIFNLLRGSLGVHSVLNGIAIDQRRDPVGVIFTSPTLYQITAVGYSDMAFHTINGGTAAVGDNPHACIVTAFPNYDHIRSDNYIYDLNDLTLVKNINGRILTNALAVNRSGYVLVMADDGKPYLLVPSIY